MLELVADVMLPRVTVVIPTYQRIATLMQGLRSLAQQSVSDFSVIVVDNAVDAAVEKSVREYSEVAPFKVSYRAEPRLGVHYGRNAAAKSSDADLLLYTDDDMTFDPRWVETYQNVFAKYPEMAAASGPVRPVWEIEPPAWLMKYKGNEKSFPILSLMEPYDSFQLGPNGFFFSCNMGIRRSILLARGGFRPEATGQEWIGDGETGLNRRMWKHGDQIGYLPDALNYHHIPATRMTLSYFDKRMANGGASDAFAKYQGKLPSKMRLLFNGLKSSVRAAPMWLAAKAAGDPESPRAIDKRLALARKVSFINYTFRLMRDAKLRRLIQKTDWMDENDQSYAMTASSQQKEQTRELSAAKAASQ
jgi:glycosyltransferase involved in cell wall biosynthesis